MGNQLAATATVDLANVSSDLELIAPLGAAGRNYFATFHCLYYAPLLVSPQGATNTTTSGSTGPPASSPTRLSPAASRGINAPQLSTSAAFVSADERHGRTEYEPNSLYYPSSGVADGSDAAGSPLRAASPLTAGAAARRGDGPGNANGSTAFAPSVVSTTRAASSSAPWSSSTVPTTQVPARERAAWHQARWQQRLPIAARPWRIAPSTFALGSSSSNGSGGVAAVSAATTGGCPSGALMDRWCRDSTATSQAFAQNNTRRSEVDAPSDYASSPPTLSPSPSFMSGTTNNNSGMRSPYSSIAGIAANRGTDIDATVAGVVGEWRGNYGNYVQVLLRGGGGVSSVALYNGQIVDGTRRPRQQAATPGATLGYGARVGFAAAAAQNAATLGQPRSHASVMLQDVVTKVFVRTADDPGQTFFLNRVRQMMCNAGEQLRVIDTTLPPLLTPRSCLWYSLMYEGDGFCVLQRPYIAFTLRERLATQPAWADAEKLFVAFQLLQAVAHLHETYGLTHGDIKPNNVLVQSTGMIVLCDMAPFKPARLPLDSPLLFDYYYDTDESRACYVAPEKFTDQPLPTPPLASKTRGNATYNVENVNFDGHTASMDVFSVACVMLFLYREEDPLTLSDVLNLHHLTTFESRKAVLLPVLLQSEVPASLHPLLLSMLCAPAEERPSARELLNEAFVNGVFPRHFSFLYEQVWPQLLSYTPAMRLRLLHNQLGTLLRRCSELDGCGTDAEGETALHTGAADKDTMQDASSTTHTTAVRILLPLLLQSIHSTRPSDDATYRGLLCLRQCVTHCPFSTLVDSVLPHLLYLVSDDAHVYGAPTRVLAIRLLYVVSETVARQLTTAAAPSAQEAVRQADEEQWALMEHLVLPCLYDVLRQGEQEPTAVLVEVAERLPRLLLLTRFMTERRQVLYGADSGVSTASATAATHPDGAERGKGSDTAAIGKSHPLQTQQPQRSLSHLSDKTSSGVDLTRDEASSATAFSAPASPVPPLQPQQTLPGSTPLPSSDTATPAERAVEAAALARTGSCVTDDGILSVSGSEVKRDRQAASHARALAKPAACEEEMELEVAGNSTVGVQQYLAQLHCLLANGWTMLQTLYNHPCVPVAVAVLRQSTSTVAAFLGEERVTEDLIPLMTTALTAPLRVLRVLFPQAILLHALLQSPQVKTLRLFVEEGLRHSDEGCLKSTLDSVAEVVRAARLPVEAAMSLVHQTLPLLMDGRLWLREAACAVVEAAAQTYSPSDVALHLEYAVRPMLTQPVPLSQLRRFAAFVMRVELSVSPAVTATMAAARAAHARVSQPAQRGKQPLRYLSADGEEESSAVMPHNDDEMVRNGGSSQTLQSSCSASTLLSRVPFIHDAATISASHPADYRDALPSVVSARPHATALHAPALLHALLSTAPTPTMTTVTQQATDASEAAPLTYEPEPREAQRLAMEAERRPTAAIAALSSHPEPPHVVDVSPLPITLASHGSVCRGAVPSSASRPTASSAGGAGAAARPSPASVSSPIGSGGSAATTAASLSVPRLRPIAAPLSSVSAHMGAIYTAAASPAANGVVVTAGSRGEARVWRLGGTAASFGVTGTRELSLVDRVPVTSSSSASDHSYVASQWMDVGSVRRDVAGGTASSSSSSSVALASTDGLVRVLDVERNAWVWSGAVGGGCDGEGTATALALHGRSSLLVTTAAGGLHVVDVRCRSTGGSGDGGGTSSSAASPTVSVWHTRLNPLDGAPSCVVPLYTADKACAAAVSTYGGVVCLFDLRFQLCAQRVVLTPQDTTTAAPSPFPRCSAGGASSVFSPLSITSACVDPLSSLCRGCRPPAWEASVAGPSLLLGTTAGTVYRLLLQSGSFADHWPALQCGSHSGSVRCLLTQPAYGSVLTGSEDGYIRRWSTDRPESSQTLSSVPFHCPPYTVLRSSSAAPTSRHGDARSASSGSGTGAQQQHLQQRGLQRLATLTVCEEATTRRTHTAVPHNAADAVLTLCTLRTSASMASATTAGGGPEGQAYLVSGARDGSLTLWSNAE